MTITAHTFTKQADALTNKLENLPSDALKVALLTAYTPAVDTHEFWADVLAAGTEVASGNGYTTGGLALTGVSVSDSGHVRTLTCNNPSWSTTGLVCAYAVFYDSSPGSNATDPCLLYWDFGGTATIGGLTIPSSGLLTITGTG